MEGLEVSIIPKSSLNSEIRYEAEFFRKRFLVKDLALARWEKRLLGDFTTVTDGPHGYHIVDVASPIAMLTAKNVKDWFTDREDADTIAKSVDDANRRSSLKAGDVVLSTRGTVGLCALVTLEVLPANIDQDVARISFPEPREFKPEFIVAYLNSRFGQDHILRHMSGMVQQGLSLQKVREIPVPYLPNNVQVMVTKTVQGALALRGEAKARYLQAEQTFLQALGLVDWQPPEPLTYTRKASEAFAATRLDAEYYAPMYSALFKRIQEHGAIRLGDMIREPIRRGLSPEYVKDGDLLVINSQHVGKTHITLDNNRTTRRVLVRGQGKRTGIVQRGDVLLNSTGRITIGRSQCLLDDVDAVVDNHVAIIRPRKAIEPVYLACFLNARPGLMQTEQSYTGSSGQIELRPEVIEDYLIWDAPYETQRAIRELIEHAHNNRCAAKKLLEQAKRAVEIAIEQSETAALHYLNNEIG